MGKPSLRHIVYCLRDERTDAIRYVGRAEDARRREAQHRKELLTPGGDSSGDARLRWLSELRAVGASFRFEVLEQYASRAQAVHAERRVIKRLLSLGHILVNVQVAAAERRKAQKPSAAAQLRELKPRAERMRQALLVIADSIEAQSLPAGCFLDKLRQTAREALS